MLLPILRYIFIVIILSIVSLFITKLLRSKEILKSRNKLIYIIVAILILQLARLPIENLIFKYNSTDKAFFCLGRGDCLGVEEGQDTSLIITENNSKQSYIYLNKENEYFKAPFLKPKSRVISLDTNNGVIVTLIQEKNTENYYAILTSSYALMNNEDENYISNSNYSTFHRLSYSNADKNNYFYLYSAYVKNVDEEDYFIDINGHTYKVFK